MITWMQRHKKYLVVTIWISAIAFVGAGFVSWGAYDFNLNRSSSVALVGEEPIKIKEFENRYQNLYRTRNAIYEGALTPERAKAEKLDLIALNNLIEDKLLLSFAKDLGLSVSEEEIIQTLSTKQEFQNEKGQFDKNLYYKLLELNQMKAKEFEAYLANDILLQKLAQIFNIKSSDEELKMITSSFYMQDILSIDVINANYNNITLDEEKLKPTWEKYKNNFTTQKSYEISTYFVKNDEISYNEETLKQFYEKNKHNYKDFNDKILSFELAIEDVKKDYALEATKTKANQNYVALRKNELNFQNDLNITQENTEFPIEQLDKAKNQDILKPFVYKEGYMIVRVNTINPARVKTYEEAKEELIPIFKQEQAMLKLEEQAKQALENFNGKNIGTVSRDTQRDARRVGNEIMDDAEFSIFLMNVFNSKENKGYVLLPNKAILYKINNQKLFNENKLAENKTMLENALKIVKEEQIKKDLIIQLRKKYPIEIYYKGSES
ncbi:peptidylprolyl isomerase [Campylobacter sp. US33a]|uniref:peptidylprolyl isomerase n=1 Tax=Campylobacter sp. US33a TaxID=2498120 RepID=UPI001067BB9E|nr:peptidylprolyl isomerase [Campylobacter sp. US33a]TEY03511.1 peptidylprolyl isomerase [Campylobacter sp. US33a]